MLESFDQDYFFELNSEVDGKQISKQGIKDINCSANCLFMTTGISLLFKLY